MTERQKDKLLFYITCLNGSAFNHGLEWGAEIFSKNERNISPINREELHNRDLEQLLDFVNSIYRGENMEASPLTKDQKKELLFHLRRVDHCACAYGLHVGDAYTTEVNPYFENRLDAVNKAVQFIEGLCPEGEPHATP